ncbi:MAG: glycosyltransferase family 2 protein [Terriglobales bacterium]
MTRMFWTSTFWGSAAVIAYTYFGYPGWLWLRSHWRPKEVQRAPYSPFVSVVMVVCNEEQVLQRKLENLLALDYPAELMQLVVVSDGSTDGTEAILHEYASNPRVNVVLNQLPRGKASGLNDAFELSQGEFVVFTDARQEVEPGALRLLLENFADPQVGCASGELMLGDPKSGESSEGLGIYWRVEKRIRELEAASGSVVGATGAFYSIRRNLLVPLQPETILDDVYLPMQVARQGFRIVFDPRARAWDGDLGSEREFARKVRTLSGNYQLLLLAPWLLTRANPIRFEFISHKLLRLIVPFALACMMVASLLLRAPVYRVALVLQLAFYGLSFLAIAQVKKGLLARAADAVFAFVVLNTAALMAFANFVTGRKPVWTR